MANNQGKKSLFVRVMAWVLSLLMVGSLGTTIVALVIAALSK